MSQSGQYGDGGNGGGGDILTITGNNAIPVGPDVAGNVDLLGVDPISVDGNAGTNTLLVSVATATTGQIGVVLLATDAEAIDGTDTAKAIVPSSLAAKLGDQTQFGVAYGDGTNMPIQWTAAATDGQLIIGATGGAPIFADLTSSDNSITFTPGSNSLDLTVTTGAVMLTLTGDTGGAVSPDGAGNIDVLGSGAINTTGTPVSNLLTISVDTATTTNLGVVMLSTSAETITGTDSTEAVVPSGLSAKLGDQTQFAVPYGDGPTNALDWTSAGTDGQLIIAATGAAPAFASLTSTGATITITPGANTLNIETASGAGMLPWNLITSGLTMVANNGYIADDTSISLALPTTSAVGDIIRITTTEVVASLTITQGASQIIRFGSVTSAFGAAGFLSFSTPPASIEMVCYAANTRWLVLSSIGNFVLG